MIMETVHKLRLAETSKEKRKILKDKNDMDWLKFIQFMFPDKPYPVKSVSDETFISYEEEPNVDQLELSLGILSGRWKEKKHAREYATRLSKRYGEMFRLVLAGSLKAGVSQKVLHESYPYLVPKPPPAVLKPNKRCILRCSDVVEGTGEYRGMVGQLLCEGFIENKFIKIFVSNGLSDVDRDKNREYYVGNEVVILYHKIILEPFKSFFSLSIPTYKMRVKDVQDQT